MIVVLQANSEAHLEALQKTASRLGLQVSDVRDEGLTEVEDETFTALAIGPDLSEKVNKVTGELELYQDPARADA